MSAMSDLDIQISEIIGQIEEMLKETASRDLYATSDLQDWLLDTLNMANNMKESLSGVF